VHAQDSSYALPELPRPLRPLWITPASARFPCIAPDASFLPVICVSASRAVDAGTERRMEGFSYVQGSGDDHELWGQVRYLTLSLSTCMMMLLGCCLFYYIVGPNATAVLGTSHRIIGVLARGPRGCSRQAGYSRTRNETNFRHRRTSWRNMEHIADACAESSRSRAALCTGRPTTRTSSQRT
jgi:Rit1 N-terminal domain